MASVAAGTRRDPARPPAVRDHAGGSAEPTAAAAATPTPVLARSLGTRRRAVAVASPPRRRPRRRPRRGRCPARPPAAPTPCPNPPPPPRPRTRRRTRAPPRHPAPQPVPRAANGADPVSLIAWAFTPIFQVLFMGLAFFYNITGDIGIAIIVLTMVIRLLLVPVFRAQIVSQRRMQMLQPELKAIQTKYKGNRAKISEEQMKLYRERGVNPASGCLPGAPPAAAAGAHVPGVQPGPQRPEHQLDAVGRRATGHQRPVLRPEQPARAVHQPRRRRGWAGSRSSTRRHSAAQLPTAACPANVPEIFIMVLPGLFGLSLLALVGSAPAARPDAHDGHPDGRPAGAQPAADLPHPAAVLAVLRLVPAGGPVHLLDHDDDLLDRPAVPHQWLGRPLPPLRVDARVREEPQAPVPCKPITPRSKPRRAWQQRSERRQPCSAKRSATDSAAGTIKPARGRSSRRGRRR